MENSDMLDMMKTASIAFLRPPTYRFSNNILEISSAFSTKVRYEVLENGHLSCEIVLMDKHILENEFAIMVSNGFDPS
jgi:hypothetical protein